MSLDIHITDINGEKYHDVMSSFLHASLFSHSTKWGNCKALRKIKDYYKSNVLFEGGELYDFIDDLKSMRDQVSDKKDELNKLLCKIENLNIISIRVSGD